jgi:hypothetical protein
VLHPEMRSGLLPLRGLLVLSLVWLVSACSSNSGVCPDYDLYEGVRPAARLVMPDGMNLIQRDGSAEVPGVGPDYVPVAQTRCMSIPPDPFATATEVVAPVEMGPVVARDNVAAAALGGSDAALVTVYTWASLWAAGDLDGYRALYAEDFAPPRGADMATWDRITANRVRVSGPRSVEVMEPSVRMVAADRAEIRFRVLERRAGSASSELSLRMVLVLQDGAWLIVEELAGPG